MTKNILLFTLSSFMILFSCSKKTIEKSMICDTPQLSPHPKSDQFSTLIDKYTQKGLPGIALLIRDKNGTWVGSSGMADIKNKIPMQACHISKVASLTKMFIGVLAFQLQEEGKLDLDKNVSFYLDKNQIKDIENADKVTVRQLLMHNTGIFDVIKDNGFYLDVLNNPPKHRTQNDILKFVRGKEPAFEPGQGPGYSNTNTLLLSMIIDKVAQKPHEQLLHEQILNPLQLNNTYYFFHDRLPEGKVAQGYYDLYNNGNLENLSSFNTGSGNGYTGIYSNVFDLMDFVDALFIHPRLLSDVSLREMLTFGNKEPDNEERLLGAGVMKDFVNRAPDEYAYGHRGRDLAYSADAFYFPEKKQTMILIVNYGTDGDSRLRPAFYDLRKAIVDEMMKD